MNTIAQTTERTRRELCVEIERLGCIEKATGAIVAVEQIHRDLEHQGIDCWDSAR
jgi:hypothetical protein